MGVALVVVPDTCMAGACFRRAGINNDLHAVTYVLHEPPDRVFEIDNGIHQCTALQYAAELGAAACVKVQLRSKSDVNAVRSSGGDPLDAALY